MLMENYLKTKNVDGNYLKAKNVDEKFYKD